MQFFVVGFAGDLFGAGRLIVHQLGRKNITVTDGKPFTWQTDQPLDVICLGIFGILKDDDIPALRRIEIVEELVDQNPITRIEW